MTDRIFGRVRVLVGDQNGKYPNGNSLWVEGSETTAVIDPSLGVLARSPELRDHAQLVLLSHVHEDHVAALSLFPQARVLAHRNDLLGVHSLDGLMEMYGYSGETDSATRDFVVNQFHYVPRPDAEGFDDGAVFDLGGSSIRVIHTPGHTRGHCVFLIEPEGVLFLGDIELSSFGPYYGDAWSSLEDFERSLALVRAIEARVWVSFHHVGVIDDRATFLARLDRFEARIAEREAAIRKFLAEPRTLDEMIKHRFLYPPHAALPFVDAVERRTLEQHLVRMERQGRVRQVTSDTWDGGNND